MCSEASQEGYTQQSFGFAPEPAVENLLARSHSPQAKRLLHQSMPLELHVGGIPQDSSASHLRSVIQSRLDPVLPIYWINTWPRFLEAGYTFVAVLSWDDGCKAIHELNGVHFGGSSLNASWSRMTMKAANQSTLQHIPEDAQEARDWNPQEDPYPINYEDCVKLFNLYPNGYPPFTADRLCDKGSANAFGFRNQEQDPNKDQARDQATGSFIPNQGPYDPLTGELMWFAVSKALSTT